MKTVKEVGGVKWWMAEKRCFVKEKMEGSQIHV